jgi:hypothetical protein
MFYLVSQQRTLVRLVGFEPTRSFEQQLLKLPRLPFHHNRVILEREDGIAPSLIICILALLHMTIIIYDARVLNFGTP